MRDPYLYEGTNTLINLAHIEDRMQLKKYTAPRFGVSLISILKNPPKITGYQELFALHKILFQHIFSWAGKRRMVNVVRTEFILGDNQIEYSNYQTVMTELEQFDINIMALQWDKMNKREFIDHISNLMITLWQIHPFREGNTRTVVVFTYLFVKQLGYSFDMEAFGRNASELRNALIWGTVGEFLAIHEILSKVIIKLK